MKTFEVGQIYPMQDICYKVIRRTAKTVTFVHETACSKVLGLNAEKVTRKTVKYDDNGNEVVCGLSVFGRLEAAVDLHTYEVRFKCKLVEGNEFISYDWTDVVDVDAEEVTAEENTADNAEETTYYCTNRGNVREIKNAETGSTPQKMWYYYHEISGLSEESIIEIARDMYAENAVTALCKFIANDTDGSNDDPDEEEISIDYNFDIENDADDELIDLPEEIAENTVEENIEVETAEVKQETEMKETTKGYEVCTSLWNEEKGGYKHETATFDSVKAAFTFANNFINANSQREKDEFDVWVYDNEDNSDIFRMVNGRKAYGKPVMVGGRSAQRVDYAAIMEEVISEAENAAEENTEITEEVAEVKKFEVGKVYINSTVFKIKVLKRTKATVTYTDNGGVIQKRAKIYVQNNVEKICAGVHFGKIALPYLANDIEKVTTEEENMKSKIEEKKLQIIFNIGRITVNRSYIEEFSTAGYDKGYIWEPVAKKAASNAQISMKNAYGEIADLENEIWNLQLEIEEMQKDIAENTVEENTNEDEVRKIEVTLQDGEIRHYSSMDFAVHSGAIVDERSNIIAQYKNDDIAGNVIDNLVAAYENGEKTFEFPSDDESAEENTENEPADTEEVKDVDATADLEEELSEVNQQINELVKKAAAIENEIANRKLIEVTDEIVTADAVDASVEAMTAVNFDLQAFNDDEPEVTVEKNVDNEIDITKLENELRVAKEYVGKCKRDIAYYARQIIDYYGVIAKCEDFILKAHLDSVEAEKDVAAIEKKIATAEAIKRGDAKFAFPADIK